MGVEEGPPAGAGSVTSEHGIAVPAVGSDVSALLRRPRGAKWLYVFAHGAGTDMRHRSMEATAAALAEEGIATLRYNFPYKERGGGRPDTPAVATATVRAAMGAAAQLAPGLRLVAGGRSFGGRMTSLAASQESLAGAEALVFFGFPLHPAGKPGIDRAEHLAAVGVPMLFLQGANDALATLELLRPMVMRLGKKGTLHVVEQADHSFHVPKRTGLSDEQVLEGLARRVAEWLPG